MLNQSHAPKVDPLSSRTFAVTTFDAPQLVVLLVEDNPGDARLIRIMLAEPGYAPVRLVHVDRLAAALERVRHSDITVVLLDLGLPDSQGLETFVELRDAVPHLPIVVLSGDTDTGLALRAVREGAQDYLLKSRVDSEILVRALRYAVSTNA
jgi:DNA-binding NarL/FixJ family response regulator